MINIKKGYNDWKELEKIVKDYKDIEDIYYNSTWVECTNYNKDDNYLDMNYKSICATTHNGKDGRPYLQSSDVEVWNEDNNICEFITYDYTNYKEEV
jgi:hypothetical protein